MKTISCLLILAGVACIVLAILMRYMGLNPLVAHSPLSYFVLANTFMLLAVSANIMTKK